MKRIVRIIVMSFLLLGYVAWDVVDLWVFLRGAAPAQALSIADRDQACPGTGAGRVEVTYDGRTATGCVSSAWGAPDMREGKQFDVLYNPTYMGGELVHHSAVRLPSAIALYFRPFLVLLLWGYLMFFRWRSKEPA